MAVGLRCLSQMLFMRDKRQIANLGVMGIESLTGLGFEKDCCCQLTIATILQEWRYLKSI